MRSILIWAALQAGSNRKLRRLPMSEPELVADCINAMYESVAIPVTVKQRVASTISTAINCYAIS